MIQFQSMTMLKIKVNPLVSDDLILPSETEFLLPHTGPLQ